MQRTQDTHAAVVALKDPLLSPSTSIVETLTYTSASAADNTVIAGINQPARDGMYFHVLITNDTSGQITFKSGGSGMAVGGTDRVFTGSANGNRVITVKKIGGAWRILV